MAKRYAPFDQLTSFGEDKVLAASGVVQDATPADIVQKVGPGRYDAWLVFDISAIVTGGAAPESYTFALEGANAADFSGDVEVLFLIQFGAAASLLGAPNVNTALGRYLFSVANQIGDREYTHVRLRLEVAGTAPSITFTSWLSKHPGA